MDRDAIERSLRVTPLPRNVSLLKSDDPHIPELELQAGRWIAKLVYVDDNDLPIWKPAKYAKTTGKRQRPKQRFMIQVVLRGDPVSDAIAFKHAGERMVRSANRTLRLIRSHVTAAKRGVRKARMGGRPPGIPFKRTKAAGPFHEIV